MQIRIDHLLAGKVKAFGPISEPSAYIKTPIFGKVEIGYLGLTSDEQADQTCHGGPDKALLHYAFDHYKTWRDEQPQLIEHLTQPGAFGENISSLGLTEQDVCIGDKFQLGTAVVEISQARQPCWKLAHRFAAKHMVKEVIQTGRSGWYYRVIDIGHVAAGDQMELLERKFPQHSVSRVAKVLMRKNSTESDLTELAELQVLSNEWQALAKSRLKSLRRPH